MSELCWLNGDILPLAEARVSVEDRGFQFADGVYEALRVYAGRPFELAAHLDRLERSCGGIQLPLPVGKEVLSAEMARLIARSGISEGQVYMQVTRGPAPRSHLFPKAPRPTVLFYIRALPPAPPVGQGEGYTLMSVPDERWDRCWIKSIALLPNVLAKNAAAAAGADEAVFIHQGIVTEGSTSNVFGVFGGTIVTHPQGPRILPGVTRDVLLSCARRHGIPVQERPMTLDQARRADEVFLTSTTREIAWCIRWDDIQIGSGRCGPVTQRVHEAFRACIAGQA